MSVAGKLNKDVGSNKIISRIKGGERKKKGKEGYVMQWRKAGRAQCATKKKKMKW